MPQNIRQLSIAACLLLVVLRVSIGWQFFYEGLWKLGTLQTATPWTAEGYLKNARGPFRDTFRNMVDDPDGLNKLDYEQVAASWDVWHQRFLTQHPDLTDSQKRQLDNLLNGPTEWYEPLAALPAGVDLAKVKTPRGTFIKYDAKNKRLATNLHLLPAEREALLKLVAPPAAEPAAAPAAEREPTKAEPAAAAPATKEADQPATPSEKPAEDAPATEKPSTEKPADDDSATNDTAQNETPTDDAPKADESPKDESATNDSAKEPDAPKADAPETDATPKDEPAKEEPAGDEPAKPEAGAEKTAEEPAEKPAEPAPASDTTATDTAVVDKPVAAPKPELDETARRYQAAINKLYERTSRLSLKERLQVLLKEDPERAGVVNETHAGTIDHKRPGEIQIYKHLLERYEANLKNAKQQFQHEHLAKQWADIQEKRAMLVGPVDGLTAQLHSAAYNLLDPAQSQRGPVPPMPKKVDQTNKLTMYLLTGLGLTLMLGLFSRLSAFGAAGLLLLFYLPMPPWPGVPEIPGPEHSLIINKNLIECFACLALAAIPTGRWIGLDALVRRFILRQNTD